MKSLKSSRCVDLLWILALIAFVTLMSPFALAGTPEKADPSIRSCGSKTKPFLNGGGGYVTQDVSLGATVFENEYCHGVYHDLCEGDLYFYAYSGGTWNELGQATYVGNCAWNYDTTSLPAGNNRIKAVFTGGNGYSGSSALMTVEVSKWYTTTTLTSSPNPSSVKQPVTLTATAVPDPNAPYTPTGKIKFFNGDKAIGTVELDQNGVATLTTKRLTAGTDSVTAVYFGDGYNYGSMSPAVEQVVNP